MIVELGHFALVLSCAFALLQFVAPLIGAYRRNAPLMRVGASAAVTQFLLVGAAYAALTTAYLRSDFSVANVVEHSHTLKPLIYKISGVWGNHEGSMMLWVLILSLFGAMVAVGSRGAPLRLQANVLAIQGLIGLAFLVFILYTSNPFLRLDSPPMQGQDLNPILQDPGLAIHPPLLYIGYVGYSVTFSFAAAALLSGRIDAAWARQVRPWSLMAWAFLTLGIAMGSYWAYYTLGWGGFWFWDPVENASLMPWLAGTALLHSIVVMEKRETLKIWTIFLAILAFSLSLLGTFLVRSGVLTSVHSFASDPQRGFFILAILVFFIGGALSLFAWRAAKLTPTGVFAPISREGALVFNNLLLTAICATILIGTLYPLALEAITSEKISVGPPFFNLTILPLAIPLFIAVPMGPMLAWKRADLTGVLQRLKFVIALSALATLILMAWRGGPVLTIGLFSLGFYLVLGAGQDLFDKAGVGRSADVVWSRFRGLRGSAWGTVIAHAGLGVSLMGIAAMGWGDEQIARLRIGQAQKIGPYEATVTETGNRIGPNYSEFFARMSIQDAQGAPVAILEPSKRSFETRKMSRTEAGIATLGLGQVYVALGESTPDGAIDARLYWKPFVTLIWIGALIMASGGALSMADRRRRIAAAAPSAARREIKSLPAS